MYKTEELPPMPSQEEIAEAVATLASVAMHAGGQMTGAVDRLDETTGAAFMFHFEIHDTRLCQAHGSEFDKRKLN